MVVTMLEAKVDPARERELVSAYWEKGGERLPPFIVETFLLRSSDMAGTWRIVTVWRSREDLDRMRESGATPAGVATFRAAGAEPELSIFDVEVHRANEDSAG